MNENNKRETVSITIIDFPEIYFKLMYDAETSYYSDPSTSSFNYLLYIYKKGMDFYAKINEKYVNLLTMRMNSIINLHFDIENNIKMIYLKENIRYKLKQLEEPKEKELLEKKIREESKEKIKKFDRDINSNIIMIKMYLRNQRNNFIKRARNKLFKKYINYNPKFLDEKENNKNINITPIKDINNDDIIRHQLMLRTKGNSNMKQYFFPTQIFFDEDKNFLFKNNINVFKKEEKFNIEEMTKKFLCSYSLSVNSIIYEFIKKINEILNENYREKTKKYKNHCEIVSFFNKRIKDDFYRKDLIINEITLHEENISYLNQMDDLQSEKNDKLIEIMDRFKINNPIDNKEINEIVNDYIYGILEVFM